MAAWVELGGGRKLFATEGFNLAIIDTFRLKVMGQMPPASIGFPGAQRAVECLALIQEELAELTRAVAARDVVGIADGVADIIVVATQLSYRCGIPIDDVLAEVHRSNMSKIGGWYNEAGKYVKPASYSHANVERVLKNHGWQGEPTQDKDQDQEE